MADKNLKGALLKSHENQRTFTYKLNDCTLSFQLHVDVKHKMQDYAKLLAEALVEITGIIDEKWPKNGKVDKAK